MSSSDPSKTQVASAYERGVLRLRSDPSQEQFVRWCYLDDPLTAARRFAASEEFAEVRRILSLESGGKGKRLLDVGSGNGIASFAFASLGCEVVSLEPDSSSLVGSVAMAELLPYVTSGTIQPIGLPIGEYRDSVGFDIVYMRQVAHHFPQLEEGIACCVHLLKPGGVLLLTREHVADTPDDVEIFKKKHALVQDGVEEQAYSAERYRQALSQAGLVHVREWGPLDSIINYYPIQPEVVRGKAKGWIRQSYGRIGEILFVCLPVVERWAIHRISLRNRIPGRLFTFRGKKNRSERQGS